MRIQILNLAAAISFACSGASASPISVTLLSEAAAHPYFERTQMSGLPQRFLYEQVVRRDVNTRALQREGNDALAIGLLGRRYQGDWPYYGYGDYYGTGDYYTTPCYWQFRCRE